MTTSRNNKGFAALVTVMIVSSVLMAMALLTSQNLAVVFDEITLKQYRIRATENALSCINASYVELEHDYFYNIKNPGKFYPDSGCAIVSVSYINSTDINKPTKERTIVVEGYSGLSSTTPRSITAKISAKIEINSQNISLISSATDFY